jgi:hypothetical protein
MNSALQARRRIRALLCFSGLEIGLWEDFARGLAKGAILPGDARRRRATMLPATDSPPRDRRSA